MPRLIFKCHHVKGGTKRSAAHLKNLVQYVATREGVERITHRENYVGYIAQRLESHGLFDGDGEPIVLSRVADEIAHHPGTVWLPIISLRREDAARLGYDNAERWRAMLTAQAPKLAEAMKIPQSQFRWYAAYHDKKDHPHVHMVCYSADGKSGFLTEHGIEQIKSMLAREIFQQDLTELYQRQTQRRDELTEGAGQVMRRLVSEMQSGTLENERIEQLMMELAHRLKNLSGKKQYGYLKAPLKNLVDEIVDELAKDSRVAAAYDLWCEQREEVLRTYKDDVPDRLPLSQQKEFKRIKNLIIEEAVRLGEAGPEFEVETESKSKQKTEAPSQEPPSTVAQSRKQKRSDVAPMVRCVSALLHHMGNIFQDQGPQTNGMVVGVDSKLRRMIREKKIAMGHRADDHEQKM